MDLSLTSAYAGPRVRAAPAHIPSSNESNIDPVEPVKKSLPMSNKETEKESDRKIEREGEGERERERYRRRRNKENYIERLKERARKRETRTEGEGGERGNASAKTRVEPPTRTTSEIFDLGRPLSPKHLGREAN